jgi:hypothetical protein
MRVVMTLLVRDEEDILTTHLDFHLAQGVDFVVAMDNGSRDATPDILRQFAERGVLEVVDGETDRYRQDAYVTSMARRAATEHGADWVINSDADEFWMPRAASLPAALGAVPDEYGIVIVRRNDFPPVADGDAAFWERMIVRETHSVTPRGTPLAPKVVHRGHPRVEVAFGNHGAAADGLTLAPPLPVLDLLHFPVRSFEQFERKTRNLGERLAATPGLDDETGRDQRELYAVLQAGELRSRYERLLLTPEAAAGGLRDGSLVADTRLRDGLGAGSPGRPVSRAPDRAVREAFLDCARWLADHRRPLELALADEQARSAATLAEVERFRSAYEAVDAALRKERAEHVDTAEQLRLLRQSRTLRLASAARRLTRRTPDARRKA